jgi:hypothetical protein
VLAANEAFVAWWVGPHQFAGTTLTLLLLAAMLARHFATTLVYALFSFGHERRLSLTAACDGVVTLIVTIALATFTTLGVTSAAIGSLAGVLLISIPSCSLALAKELQVTLGELVVSTRGWAIRFAAAAAVSLLGARFIDAQGVAGLLGIGLLVAAAYGALMSPLGPYVRAAAASAAGVFGVRREAVVEPRG